ncbi:MAG: HAD-IA family hydrolase [Candidatus Nanoarchaeia archaeon]|nr:HAD-IA family hydrolase [Candidatus Nanoarchaeia archaeon]
MALIFFDWDGTLCKGEVAEQGCVKLNEMLGNKVSKEIMINGHKDNSHFDEIRKSLQNYTGIINNNELTKMMTNIFEINYLNIIKEKGNDSLYSGINNLIKELKQNNHKIIIISSSTYGTVKNSSDLLNLKFDAIYANDSYLTKSKRDLFLKAANELGEPIAMIGDREEDMLSKEGFSTKIIFCQWGHGVLKKALPDYKINNVTELKNAFIDLKLL